MTPQQRQSAIDRVKDSLEALVALAQRPEGHTPMKRQIEVTAQVVVDDVFAILKPRPQPMQTFKQEWPQAFPRPEHETDDEWVARMSAAVERLR